MPGKSICCNSRQLRHKQGQPGGSWNCRVANRPNPRRRLDRVQGSAWGLSVLRPCDSIWKMPKSRQIQTKRNRGGTGRAPARNRFIFQLINFDSDTASPVRSFEHFMGQLTGKATNCLIEIYVKAINSLWGQLPSHSSFKQTELWSLNLIIVKEISTNFHIVVPSWQRQHKSNWPQNKYC